MPAWIRKPLIVVSVLAGIAVTCAGIGYIVTAVVNAKEAESRKLYKDVVKRLEAACYSKHDKEIVRQFKASHWPDEGDVAKDDLDDWAQYCAGGRNVWVP